MKIHKILNAVFLHDFATFLTPALVKFQKRGDRSFLIHPSKGSFLICS